MWASKTAREAHDVLVKPDVKVTNQSDKDVQLPKLLNLDDFARREFLAKPMPSTKSLPKPDDNMSA